LTLHDNIASYVQNTCQDSKTAGLKYLAGLFIVVDLPLMDIPRALLLLFT